MLAHSVFCLGLVYFDLQMELGMSSLRYPYTLEPFSPIFVLVLYASSMIEVKNIVHI